MSRSNLMAQLLRLARLAERSEQTGESPAEAIGQEGLRNASRRQFTKGAMAATATAAVGSIGSTAFAGIGGKIFQLGGSSNIAVIGAGLAGLSCANELARLGIQAKVFEAAERVGGRCASLRGYFPGQVVERGGEFINSSHQTMIGFARELGLALEDFSMFPGTPYYQFGGRMYSEAQVAEEYRQFAVSIRQDLGALSYPTADRFNETDSLFDFMSLDDYLILHGAGGLLRSVISAAYMAEFGANIEELSAISFLRFIYSDKRSKLAPFGVFGGEHLRVVEGNDRIATGLAGRLPNPVALGHKLVAMRKLSGGKFRLSFEVAGRTIQSDHDVVVMTLPFSVLRDVKLDASLELPAWKHLAINNAGMGDHSKVMLGFKQPYWYVRHGMNGTGYSDSAYMQSTWEANPSKSSDSRAVLVGYTGGAQARTGKFRTAQTDGRSFLSYLEGVLPGANENVQVNARGKLLAVSENWSSNPLSKGSHSCNRPGYFTTIAHNEAKAIGNLLFAGEHTSSFYEWQGFMEGAALSGLRAASEAYSLVRAK
jgi:monoamine oxidase